MKRVWIISFMFVFVVMVFASCSNNSTPIGRWAFEREGVKIPLLITDKDIVFYEGTYKEMRKPYKIGENGRIEVDFPIDMRYDKKNDKLIWNVEGVGEIVGTRIQTDEEYRKLIDQMVKMIEVPSIKANMHTVQVALEVYRANNKIYPKSKEDMEKIGALLPDSFVNPIYRDKGAYYYGTEDPQWSEDRVGAVYVKYYEDGSKYKIYGYGKKEMVDLTLAPPENLNKNE